jgi:hypothetical protein
MALAIVLQDTNGFLTRFKTCAATKAHVLVEKMILLNYQKKIKA